MRDFAVVEVHKERDAGQQSAKCRYGLATAGAAEGFTRLPVLNGAWNARESEGGTGE